MNAFGVIFFHILISGIVSVSEDDLLPFQERDDLQFKFIKESLRFVKSFDKHYDRICRLNHEQTIKTYGTIATELIAFRNFGKDENEINPVINEEIKYLVVYSYFNALLVDFQIEILTNSFVVHVANWMKLNFQACTLFYEHDQTSDIFRNCKELADYLDVFVTTAAYIRNSQFAQFKRNTIEDLKDDVGKKVINEKLVESLSSSRVVYPDPYSCEFKNHQDEKNYCQIWINLINAPENRQFRQNHTFFDAYLGLRDTTPYIFDTDDFLSDYENSKTLWDMTEYLVKYTRISLVKDRVKKGNVVGLMIKSNATEILREILKFKKNVLKAKRKERESSKQSLKDDGKQQRVLSLQKHRPTSSSSSQPDKQTDEGQVE